MKLLFVTNMTAPYRYPVWDEMAAGNELDVWLLHDPHGGGSVLESRTSDWKVTGEHAWTTRHLDTARLTKGEGDYYLLTPQARLGVAGYDAVVLGGWESPAYWQIALAARLARVPVVVFYESTLRSASFTSGPIAWARSVFLRWADRVVVPGAAARAAAEHYGVRPEQVHEGFNAVDVARFAAHNPAVHGPGARRDGAPVRIVFVGRLIPLKNLDALITAFARLDVPAELTVIGDGPEGDSLRALASDLGVSDRVHFEGFVPYDELPERMATHDILALVSTREVWGLVVNEALAAGLSVVVGDACGVADSVRGMHGVTVTGTTVEEIAKDLRAAVHAYAGHVERPEILRHTPQALAHVLLDAVRTTNSEGRRRAHRSPLSRSRRPAR